MKARFQEERTNNLRETVLRLILIRGLSKLQQSMKETVGIYIIIMSHYFFEYHLPAHCPHYDRKITELPNPSLQT